ncbi:MAG: carboxypeptidase M32 [Deltaproteobacteria bacterium]|nr:carboxypeptidase M32 [Deltaproteobacteria bacterium]
MNIKEAYNWLSNNSKEIARLGAIIELAAWDQRTCAPEKSHGNRANQIALLSKIAHSKGVDKKTKDALDVLKNNDFSGLDDSLAGANVKVWLREYERSSKISADLNEKLALTSANGEAAWESGMKNGDFSGFYPVLKELIDLTREKAESIGYKNEPYDALVDEYEPGITTSDLDTLFCGIADPIKDLVLKISDKSSDLLNYNHDCSFDIEAQKSFSRQIVDAIGYDLAAGRIDEAVHPFTVGIGPGDVRITTRYNPDNLSTGIFGSIHEAGHAMYEQGLHEKAYGTPAGSYASLGVHESQSRLWENMVGRSEGFWQWAFPIARGYFDCLQKVSSEEFLSTINRVSPGLIRVEADEVTYNLHVLIRFEIERELFRNNINVEDIEALWNEKMQKYLGVKPANLKEGAMQDVHWSAGMFGYFPTYTLGNIYSAQLFKAAESELGSLDKMFSEGIFKPLLGWLNKNIHTHGAIYGSSGLIEKATSNPVSSKYFIDYLKSKYSNF